MPIWAVRAATPIDLKMVGALQTLIFFVVDFQILLDCFKSNKFLLATKRVSEERVFKKLTAPTAAPD